MYYDIDPVELTFEETVIGLNLSESGMIPAAFAIMPSAETMA